MELIKDAMPATITEMRFKVAFSGGWLICPGFNPCCNGSMGNANKLVSILVIMEVWATPIS